jgi:hypothetical protein
LVLWAAIAGGGAVACQSDSGSICEKLFACHLLHDVPPSKDGKQKGFSRDICESQVEAELSDTQQADCADCIDGHDCGEIAEACRPDCTPHYD